MKKKLSYLMLLVMCSIMVSPVYAENIKGCYAFLGDKVQIDEKIANTVHIIILIIQIVTPILLVIFGMIDLMKAVISGKEDEIKKNQMVFVKRLIAAAIVFFVFLVVKLVISLVADNADTMFDCADCFINGAGSGKTCEVEKNS